MRAPMPPPQQHTHASQNSFPPATSVNVSSTAAPPPPPVSYFTTSSVPNPTASHHRATPDYAASADECSGAATTAVPSTVPVSGMGVDGIRDSACGLHTYNSAGSEELPFSSHVYSSSGIVDATHSAANNVASGGTLHQLAHSSLSSSGVADASHIRRDRGARTVRTQREAAVPPPSAAAQTAAGVLAAAASAGMGGVPPEPFHNWGGSTLGLDMMMHDLRRLVHPEAVLNRCVYVNVPDRIPSSRHRVEEKAEQGPPPSQAGPRSRTRAARNGPQGTPSVTCPDSTQFGDQLLAAAVRRGHLLSPLSSAAALQNGGGSLGGAAWRAPSSQAQPSLGSLGKAGLLPRMNQPGASKRDLGTGLKASSSAARPPGIAPKSGSPWMGPGPEAPAIGGGASVAQSGPLPPLQFESNFESGNLRAAVQVYENEYDLFLATDLNDRSEGGNLCQWFYFAVTGVQPGVPYKFNLVNFRKKQSLFASGVQPLVCCCRDVGVSSSSQNAFSADNSVCPDGPVSDSVALSLQQQQQQQQPDPSCCRRSLDSAAFSYTSGVSTLSRANSGSSNTFGSSNVPSQYQPARLSPQPYSQLSPTQSLSQLPNAKIEQQQQPLQQQRGERSGRLSAQGMLSPSLSRVGSARADPSRSPSTSTQPSHHMHRPTPPPSRPPLGSRSSTTNSSNRSSADFTPSNPHHPHSQQQQPQQQQQQQQQQPHQTWGCVHGLCNMPGTWARSGSHVAYYPSPYRGRPTTTGVAEPGPKRGVKKSSSSNSKKASGRSSSSTNPSISAPTAGAAATPTTASNASGATAGVATAGSGSMTAGAAQGGGSSSGRGSGRGDGKGGEGVGLGGPVYGDAGPGLYCCTFTLQFPETHATYYIASCYPYTYTDLQEHLDLLTVRLDPSHHSPHSLTDHHQQHHQQQHEVQQQQIQQQTTTQQPHPPYPLQQQHHQQHHQQLLQQQPQHPFEATGTQIRQSSGAASSHRYPQSSDSVPSLSIAPLSIPPLSAPEPLNPRDLESQPPTVIGGMLVRSLLCYTLAGHRVECLTITDFNAPLDLIQQREAIVLTARVHPGESNASWIMQGVLDFLTSDAPAALTLRKSFVFKIVPMLNPDGVINGSYRCSLAGVDLNRTWEHPVKWLHPSVYHTKKVLAQLASACRLALYVDIHGHSNKEDAFFYGCEPNVAGLDKTPPPPTPATTVVASNTGQGGGGGQMASPARPGFLSRPGGSAFEVDAPVPGGYITSGCDGLNWEAPGSLAAMPLMFVPPAMQSSALSVSGTSNWPTAQAAPQQVAGQQGWAGAAGNTMVIAGSQPPSARQAARLRVRMLPYLASCISTDYSLSKCGFRIRRAKLGAARVVAYRELGCAGAYTLEASLGGRAQGRSHFSAADYIGLGENLCRGVAALAEVDDAALLEDMAKNVTLPPMPASFS